MHRDLSEQHTKGEVLIVEDTPASLKLLSDLLTEAGYYVRQAPNGELALWSAQSRPPELILLDIRMPGIDGFEVCRRLKATPELSQVPVIFLSAQHDTDDKVRGFELGAVDFIAKPFQAEEILARTDAHVKLGARRRRWPRNAPCWSSAWPSAPPNWRGRSSSAAPTKNSCASPARCSRPRRTPSW
jgi:DNA-binding response OmpR family regulator